MRHFISIIALAGLLTLPACMSVAPMPPRIERLAEGAAGPVVPAMARPLSLTQVADMARSGTPSNVIIQSLRDSRAAYAISAAEAGELSRQGVPYEVVEYLRWGERRPAQWAPYPYVDPYSYPYTYPYSYPVYAPFFVVPSITYSRWGFGRHPRYPAAGISLRFGLRR